MPVAAAAGYVGTKFMEPISPNLYEWEPEKEREREYEVGPGAPLGFAAENRAPLVGVELDDKRTDHRC